MTPTPRIPRPRRALLALGALVLLAAGCANVVYRGPVIRVDEEVRNRTVVKERIEFRLSCLAAGEGELALIIEPVKVKEVSLERREFLRETGRSIAYNPLFEVIEYASLPVFLGLGVVMVYRYWTYDDETGGVGEGMAAARPDAPVGLEDVEWRALAAALDDVVRDPASDLLTGDSWTDLYDWWILAGDLLNVGMNSRFPFSGLGSFGTVGPWIEGPWEAVTREEIEPAEGVVPAVQVNGKKVETRSTLRNLKDADGVEAKAYFGPPGAFQVTARPGPGPLVIEVEGGGAKRRIEIGAEEWAAWQSGDLQDSGPEALRLQLGMVEKFSGETEALRLVQELADREGLAPLADAVEAWYRGKARALWAAGDKARALRLEALGAFHAEVLRGNPRAQADGGAPSRRLLVEGLGSTSFLERARSAVRLTDLEGVDAGVKTAALLALLGKDPHPVARWAYFWALGRCGEGVAETLEAVAAREGEPVLKAQALRAAAAIGARDR